MRNGFGDPSRVRHIRVVGDDESQALSRQHPGRVRVQHIRAVSDATDDEFVWYCDNGLCGRPLGDDHIVVLTTCHVRRFHHMGCVIEGYQHHLDQIFREVTG